MADGEWLSLGDAAHRLCTTPDAIRQRIRRNKILARRGNDGRPRVFVESGHTGHDEYEVASSPVIPNRTAPGNTEQGEPVVVVELRRQLEQQAAQHRADIVEQQALERAETARRLTERDALYQDTLGRLATQVGLERSLLLERIDAAECRSERLEQRLDAVLDQLLADRRQLVENPHHRRRPWWRRWFGSD